MALTIQVDGKALIQIASPANGTLEDLGYTMNGVEITENLYVGDVSGDENGGEEGPPIDIQYFGQVDVIRMLFTKWDEAVLNKIRAALAGGTAGTPGVSGTLYFQGAVSFQLKINTANRPRIYRNVIFREPKEINKGTKHSRAMIVATAYKDANGILHSAT